MLRITILKHCFCVKVGKLSRSGSTHVRREKHDKPSDLNLPPYFSTPNRCSINISLLIHHTYLYICSIYVPCHSLFCFANKATLTSKWNSSISLAGPLLINTARLCFHCCECRRVCTRMFMKEIDCEGK